LSAATAQLDVVLCVDLEPDGRDRFTGGATWSGTERLWHALPRLRTHIEQRTGGPAHAWWFLRMDPQIAVLHGDAGWGARRFAGELASVRAYGDELGLHTHAWRPAANDGWISDHGNPHWVAHCVDVSRRAFLDAFGHPPRAFRFGDRWMSNALARKLARDGFCIDFTPEPGFPAQPAMRGSDCATGSLPDYRGMPAGPYRPSHLDFRWRATVWPSRLRIAPVSTACVACARAYAANAPAVPHDHRPATLNLALRTDHFARVLAYLTQFERRSLLVAVMRSADLAAEVQASRMLRNMHRLLAAAGTSALRFCGPERLLPASGRE